MRRATITIPEEVDAALEAYLRDQDASPALTAVVQRALREFLSTRGYLSPVRTLRITPARRGSGRRDVSIHHDRYLAGR